MLAAVRAMPRLVGGTLRRAWPADRPAMVAVAVSEIGQGIAAAVGLLAVNAVMHALLGGGAPVDRLYAALPALVTVGVTAVVNAGLACWSTSRAGRLEPLVERLATAEYLAAALAGSAQLELVSGVVQLLPEDAMFDAMLRGWRAQQKLRGLKDETIDPR
ncbi:hypothetical protein ACISU4_12890 [Streptomyces wuyuanensis]|uniref:hypothetical protein n=1 Tax=Streptomyces wuyuanensis TaxID=1196353 RepID=UPI003825C101